jgi:hypothetical protein
VGSTPQEFGAIIRADIAKRRRLVEQAGIKADQPAPGKLLRREAV